MLHFEAGRDASRRNVVYFQIAFVPQLQAVVRAEHAEALSHIAQRRVELNVADGDLEVGPSVGYRADQTADNNRYRNGGNSQRQGCVGKKSPALVECRFCNQPKRSHRDEMMRYDSEHQQDRVLGHRDRIGPAVVAHRDVGAPRRL